MAVKKILVFGNPLVREDSLPLKILPALQKEFPEIEFREMDGIEDVQEEGKELFILDSVMGLKKAAFIKDIGLLEPGNRYSTHDFDVAHNLKILKKIGAVEKVIIIGIPMGIGEKNAFRQAKKLISFLC